jgi:hypothetical protein
MMLHLNGWNRILARPHVSSCSVIVFDHGPFYMLTALREFGPDFAQESGFHRWWGRRLTEWASRLDMVVWLDAPNSVLADRIDDRDHKHIIKGRSQQEKQSFLGRYRSSFGAVMSMATARNDDLGVYRYRTEYNSTAQITEEILGAIDLRLKDPGLR